MSHHVSGLIANAETLARIAVEHGLPAPRPLEFADFAFLPLDEDNLDALPGITFAEMADDRFRFLSPSLIDWIGRFDGREHGATLGAG